MVALPLTPAPPTTTNAPVVVLVLAVPDAATMLPLTFATPVTSKVERSVAVPVTSINPPMYVAPLIPVPPATTNAPVVVLELAVPLAATKLPLLICTPLFVNVVNAPVAAVLAPIG